MTHHARKLVSTLLPVGAATAMLVLGGTVVPAYAATATDTSCSGVLSGAPDNPLQKTVEDVTPTGNPDEYTITYRVTDLNRDAGTYRLRDCAWIDQGGNQTYDGEPLVGSADEKDYTFVANTGGGSTTTFTQTVVVPAGSEICDRAAMSGTASDGTSFTDKSNVLCFSPNNPPVVPESALAVTLPLAAVAAVGGVLYLQRRRRTATSA